MKPIAIALSLSMLSFGAIAGEATIFDDTPQGTRSRAEVHAEVIAALAAGERLSQGEGPSGISVAPASTVDRASVLAQAIAARQRGELADGEATLRGRL
jgi:hypothetical protein